MSAKTPFQLAQRECAEWIALEGGCIRREDRRCVLAGQQPCAYFKDAVLPLADKFARYGSVKQAWAALVERWRAMQATVGVEALAWAGRVEGRSAPCGACLNCRNGQRQICLCRKDTPQTPQEQPQAITPGIVSSYCLRCHAPLYQRHARHCSERCRKESAKLAYRAQRDKQRQGRSVRGSKPLDTIELKEAL